MGLLSCGQVVVNNDAFTALLHSALVPAWSLSQWFKLGHQLNSLQNTASGAQQKTVCPIVQRSQVCILMMQQPTKLAMLSGWEEWHTLTLSCQSQQIMGICELKYAEEGG